MGWLCPCLMPWHCSHWLQKEEALRLGLTKALRSLSPIHFLISVGLRVLNPFVNPSRNALLSRHKH